MKINSSTHRVATTRSVMAVAVASVVATSTASAQSMGDTTTGSQFTIGAGAAFLPRYEGSDDHRTRALPLINYRNGRFFAGALGGVGYDFSPVPSVSFGPLLSYRFGRDEDESDRLRGLGDVDGGLDVGVFARWNLQPFFLHANVRRGVTGDDKGTQIRFGAGHVTRFSESDSLIVDVSADWADSDVMQGYFGVDAGQSLRSGLRRYDADSGIRRYGASLIWTHAFSRSWFTTAGVSVYRLGTEAADSPIVERRTLTGASVGVGYRF